MQISTRAIRRTASRAGAALAMSALLVGFGAAEAGAQEDWAAKELVFDVRYPEFAESRDEKRKTPLGKRLNSDEVGKMLAESGRLVYKGRERVEAQLVVFVVGERGERERIVSRPFELEPREGRDGEMAPLECALAECTTIERELSAVSGKLFPDGYFFPDDYFFPDSTFGKERFPDSTFSGDFFPDSTFEEAGLERGQIGVMLLAVPTDEELQREARLGSSIIIFDRDEDG